jgi:hypothetical protein
MSNVSIDVPTHCCVECGEPNDCARPMEDGTVPSEGSISICLYCRHIAIYRADQSLREPTDDELIEISQRKDVKEAMKILGQIDS